MVNIFLFFLDGCKRKQKWAAQGLIHAVSNDWSFMTLRNLEYL